MNQEQPWEKEFNELKKGFIAVEKGEWWASDEDYIKDFIREVVREAEERGRNEADWHGEKLKDAYEEGKEVGREEAERQLGITCEQCNKPVSVCDARVFHELKDKEMARAERRVAERIIEEIPDNWRMSYRGGMSLRPMESSELKEQLRAKYLTPK